MVEKRRRFLINFCYYIAIIAIVLFVFRYVVSWCFPFLLGFGVAAMMQGVIKRLTAKVKGQNKLITFLVVTLFYLIIGTLVTLATIQLMAALGNFFKALPAYYSTTVEPALEVLLSGVEDVLRNINPSLVEDIQDVNGTIFNVVKSIAPSISSTSLASLTSFVSFVPSFLLSLMLMIISSYFFAFDFHKITDFVMLQFNDSTKVLLSRSKVHTIGTLVKFIKSYGIIMAITFLELSVGFMILRIDNAIAIAFVIAIFDILPVLGTGGIMIPWIIISLLNGNVQLAVGLLIVYVIVTVVRNIIEPKIVGVQVGAHPMVMLISMFLGVKLLGILGILVLPILVILIKNLNEDGILHLYKMTPEIESNKKAD